LILAGGAASRLADKLSLPVEGEPMLVRVYRRLTATGRPCIISAPAPLDAALRDSIGAPVVADEYKGVGPLGGLASATGRVETPLTFVSAGDMPDIDATFIDALEGEFDRSVNAGIRPDAVIPHWGEDRFEPLAALYDTRALALAARSSLERGVRKVMDAFGTLRVVRYEIRSEDEAKLRNVNTPADYERLHP
jgi:molybdopterin-guanine dinucleotide biosynthesis protein A